MIEKLKPYPAYKDSGVEWLGKVPAHWEVRAIRHITSPVKGKQPKALYSKDEAPAGAQPYLTMQYMRGHKGTAKALYSLSDGLVTARKGDVLLLWDGANAGEFFLAKDGVVPSTAALLATDKHDRHYLYFMLKQCEPWLRAFSTGMGIPHVDGSFLKQMQIALPPLSEQTAIVRFLDYMDRRIRRYIRAKQRLIKLLEEYKQALIHQAVIGQIDVRTGEPYPAYKESGVEWLGKVPEHWKVVPLKFLSRRVQNGSTPPTSNEAFYHAGTVPWYGPSSCGYEEQVGKPVRLLNEMAFQSGVARLISAPALLVVVIGATAGRMALLNQNGATNQQITAYELNTKQVIPAFAIKQLRPAESWLRGTASTATIPILNTSIVSRLLVALPPLPEQIAIVEYLDAQTAKIDAAMAAARREIELLREYRTRLIADVVTGKVDVREVAAQLPEEPPEEGEWMDTEEAVEGEAADDEAIAETFSEEEVAR